MQISNQSILSAAFSGVGSALNRRLPAEQYAPKSVTLEGQLIKGDEDKKRARKQEREDLSTLQQDSNEQQKNTEITQLLVNLSPVSQSEDTGRSLLIDNQLSQKNFSRSLQAGGQTPEQSANLEEHSFPYSNRRSDNGLAGGALIIQKYLNNEPAGNHKTNSFINTFI
ncbi:MAG: hypothetical protein KZQ83_04155 [gamma proteobacterium symbiont of Taylorina sp.]|nr:hypothetical protein [gamma proteobacterium symbiont of Taylorina sp.]